MSRQTRGVSLNKCTSALINTHKSKSFRRQPFPCFRVYSHLTAHSTAQSLYRLWSFVSCQSSVRWIHLHTPLFSFVKTWIFQFFCTRYISLANDPFKTRSISYDSNNVIILILLYHITVRKLRFRTTYNFNFCIM